MSGRGSWSNIGGTFNYYGTLPGPYYRTPAAGTRYIGSWAPADVNERAVVGAVKAYQQALVDRGIALGVDGIFGPTTRDAVVKFQQARGITVDGIIGRTTSKMLLCPDLQSIIKAKIAQYPSLSFITPQIVCGEVSQESAWDAGAVGYSDPNDIGIAQINGNAWPYTEEQRLDPKFAFAFIFDYFKTSINDSRINTVDDMIISYNLGVGGAARWASQGRPVEYYVSSTATTPRYPWSYINNVKTACKLPPR